MVQKVYKKERFSKYRPILFFLFEFVWFTNIKSKQSSTLHINVHTKLIGTKKVFFACGLTRREKVWNIISYYTTSFFDIIFSRLESLQKCNKCKWISVLKFLSFSVKNDKLWVSRELLEHFLSPLLLKMLYICSLPVNGK